MLVGTEVKLNITADSQQANQTLANFKQDFKQAALLSKELGGKGTPAVIPSVQVPKTLDLPKSPDSQQANQMLANFKQDFKQAALLSKELGGQGFNVTSTAQATQNKDLVTQSLSPAVIPKAETPAVIEPKIPESNYTQQAKELQQSESQKQNGILAKLADSLFHTEKKKEIEKIDLRLEMLSNIMDELNDQLKKATEYGDDKGKEATSNTIANTQKEIDSLQARKNELTAKDDNSAAQAIQQYGLMRALQQGLGLATQIDNIGFNSRKAFASGDYLGAEVSEKQGWAGVFGTLGDVSLGLTPILNAILPGLGAAIGVGGGVVGKGVQFLTNRGANDESASLAEAAAYERTISHTNALNKLFTNGGSVESNREKTQDILRDSVSYAKGTGLDNYEFIDLASRMQQNGTAHNANVAMEQARDVARFSNNTGADIETVSKLYTSAKRYGKEDGDILGYLDKARQASGLEKGQTAEYLQAVESVIEDGIANGFTKSTKEVAQTLGTFQKLSGNNPLWTGAQGARRLQQMNSSVSSATAMQSTSQMLVVGAAKNLLSNAKDDKAKRELLGLKDGEKLTGTYIDTMRLVEQGNNPKMFGEIARQVKEAEGNNVAGQIEQFKAIFGMNYTGATQVYEMAQKIGKKGYTEKDFAADIEKMKGSGQYSSEETKKQESINVIQSTVALLHNTDFKETLAKLDAIATEKGNELLRLEKSKQEEKTKDTEKEHAKKERDENIKSGEKATGYKYSEVKDNLTTLEREPIEENLAAKGAMARANTQVEKANATKTYLLSPEGSGKVIGDAYAMDFYNKFTQLGNGNDTKDFQALSVLSNYNLTPDAVYKALNTIGKGESGGKGAEAFKAYNDNRVSPEQFAQVFETMLTKVFKNISLRTE